VIDTGVVILGAGMSGICMAIKLREAGIDDLVILEKSPGAGGTWHDNTYPGACCDVASHLYSFSFEPNPDWSRAYSPHNEIREYFERCVDKYALASSIRYQSEANDASYDAVSGRWTVTTTGGDMYRCRVLVSGLGQLNRPNIPGFPGMDSFQGPSFHSARWDHSVDLRGKRVAVIGNAASAIQLIPPVAEVAEQVYVYQRSANYIVPRNDHTYSDAEKGRFRNFPWMMKLTRLRFFLRQELLMFGAMLTGSLRNRLASKLARATMEEHIADPVMREQLTPDYPLGCKRILVSDDYYPALASGKVELVTSPIQAIGESGVITEDDIDRDVDVIVYATGFKATEFLATVDIQGIGGHKLAAAWAGGAEALHGIAVPDFPNLFLLYGPNTNLGHNSIIYMVEAQVRYITQCIGKMLAHDIKALEADATASQRYNAELQAALEDTVWGGECGSWYKNAEGKIINNWPHSAFRYRQSMRQPDFSEYRMSV
jgi:cation diffusion facilitator CzcD-associated flavoprotein CzcO